MGSDREYLGVEPRPGVVPDSVEDRLVEETAFDGWADRMNDGIAVANTEVDEAGDRDTGGSGLHAVADLIERALYVEYAAESGAHVGYFYGRSNGDGDDSGTESTLERIETVGGEGFSLRAVTDYCKREYDFDALR